MEQPFFDLKPCRIHTIQPLNIVTCEVIMLTLRGDKVSQDMGYIVF
jgi:hypothetical protein